MDKIKEYLQEYYDIDLNDLRCNRRLYELIVAYGDDCHNDGWQAGYDQEAKSLAKSC